MTIEAKIQNSSTINAKITTNDKLLTTVSDPYVGTATGVTTNTSINVSMVPYDRILVTKYQIDASNISLNDMTNISFAGLADGAVLVYNGALSLWEATTEVVNPNTTINGGNF